MWVFTYMKHENTMIRGAFILGLGTFIAKLLGAIYRVPLTNLIGGYGLGLYQMVFPVYSVLLDFSGAGAPNAISKLVSSQNELKQKKILLVSKRLLFVFSIISFIFMLCFSGVISKAQGNADAKFAYITLSPAVIGVALISCYRGYFQGRENMYPTAVSQIIEQFVKISLGLILVYFSMPSVVKSVGYATLAITISEFFALIYLVVLFKRKNKGVNKISINKSEFLEISLNIIKYALPITLIGVILPFSQVIDSFILINGIKKYLQNATSLYGLLSGVALTVINLPVSICYGLATSVIPAVSKEKNARKKTEKIKKSILLTFLISLIFAIFCAVFSKTVVNILFKNLDETEKIISQNLIKILSITVVFLSVLQTTNAVLISSDLIIFPIISLSIGVTIKIVLEYFLLKIQSINIYAGAIGLIACYFIVVLINLIIILIKVMKNANKTNSNWKNINQE